MKRTMKIMTRWISAICAITLLASCAMSDTAPTPPMTQRQLLLRELSHLNVHSIQVGQAYTQGETVSFVLDSDFLFGGPDSSTLTTKGTATLKKIGDILNTFDTENVQIIAYTDNQGDPTFLQALSTQQARVIENTLWTRFHVDTRLLSAVGMGEQNPITDNSTPYWQSQNRRVVIQFRFYPDDEL